VAPVISPRVEDAPPSEETAPAEATETEQDHP
jgi:hypothetical protein